MYINLHGHGQQFEHEVVVDDKSGCSQTSPSVTKLLPISGLWWHPETAR